MQDQVLCAGAHIRRSTVPERAPLVVSGGALLALRASLRARGLRGLDVLRRSQDRAPPATA